MRACARVPSPPTPIDAVLPQTQCTRCGYAAAAPTPRRSRRRRDQPLPAGRRGAIAALARAHRARGRGARPRVRRRTDRSRRAHRRGPVHRLHAVHRRLPGRRDRRRAEADAHGARRAVHRLRAVPPPLPGRLHRHDPAGRALVRCRRRGGAGASPRAQRAPRPRRAHRRPRCRGRADARRRPRARSVAGRRRAAARARARRAPPRATDDRRRTLAHRCVPSRALLRACPRPRGRLLRARSTGVGLREPGASEARFRDGARSGPPARARRSRSTRRSPARRACAAASTTRTRRSTRSARARAAASPRVRVRYLLERGRAFNSVGRRRAPSRCSARPHEAAAARPRGRAFYDVDALHMLGIATPPAEQLDWNLKALAAAEARDRSARPRLARLAAAQHRLDLVRARRRRHGARLLAAGARGARSGGDAPRIRVARWTLARGYRARRTARRRRADPARARRADRARARRTATCTRNSPRSRSPAATRRRRAALGGEGARAAPHDAGLAANDPARLARLERSSVPAGAGPAADEVAMNAAKRRAIFERLRAANPHPTTELEHATPFELLVAVVLSAQATDKGVNKATAKLFPVANTPAAIAALGVDGLIPYVELDRPLPQQGEERRRRWPTILVREHGGDGAARRARRSSAAGRRPQDRERRAQHRVRRADDRRRHAHLPRREPHRPRARQGPSSEVERGCSSRRPGRVPAGTRTTG